MRIAFVNASRLGTVLPNLGVAYISAYLKKHIPDIEIVYFEGFNTVFESIKKFKPDLVGFSIVTPSFKDSCNLGERVKKEIGCPIIFGGPHVTSIPEITPRFVDVAVIGEGEQTALELVRLFERKGFFDPDELKNIKGIAYYSLDKFVKNVPRELVMDLDSLPHPDRSLFDYSKRLVNNNLDWHTNRRTVHMLASRGCPYACAFCYNSKKGQIYRQNSAKYIIEEIEELYEKYGVEGICFSDDLFAVDKKRMMDIIKLLRERGFLGKIKFNLSCRANLMDEERAALAKEMGVVHIAFGFESGSDRILSFLKGGSVKVSDNQRAVDITTKYGMYVAGTFMMGTPGETKDDMMATLEFFRKNTSIINGAVYITTPLPGTFLWDYCISRGTYLDVNKVDWNILLNEKVPVEKWLYINDVVPKEECLKIFNEFREISIQRLLIGKKLMSFEMISKAVKKPRLAIFVMKTIIKHGKTEK